MLREDEIHPFVSGNKYRKLKYNIAQAKILGKKTLLTFGGAFSNHIAAVAAAGATCNFKTVGIIRGEELKNARRNATLTYAASQGMDFYFMSRSQYKDKYNPDVIRLLKDRFDDFYLIPEGGTNPLAVKGCEEILAPNTYGYDYICAPVGTGGTLAGLVNASQSNQNVIGFSALKGNFLTQEVQKFTSKTNFEITEDYVFGGYGKIDVDLVRFINDFKKNYVIPLDPIYTGKMMFGIFDMISKGKFKENSRILAIHTGGLQGIVGMNEKLKRNNLPIIV